MKDEVGGHRFQRIPPTERKGRVHTSSVKVALIDAKVEDTVLNDRDLKIEWFSGTGKGGQHRNKHQTSCRLINIPTGMSESRQGRSRESNLQDARQALEIKLKSMDHKALTDMKTVQYKESGSGQRGDKIRTIRFQDNQAWDERSGKIISAKAYMNGGMKEFWND